MSNEMRAFVEALRKACTAMAEMSDIWQMLEGHEDDIVQNLSGWQGAFNHSLDEIPFMMVASLQELEEKLERYK